MHHKFIVFEGGDGTGKSTQARRLAENLKELGEQVVLTREPGGTKGAEEIRELLLTGDPEKLVSAAELLLFYAARVDHVQQLIVPALKEGKIVITDRFDLSTWAFQTEHQPDLHGMFDYLHNHVTAPLKLMQENQGILCKGLLLDVLPEVALERMGERGDGLDRMEQVEDDVVSQRREAYLQKSGELFPVYEVIDASADEDTVFQLILDALSK